MKNTFLLANNAEKSPGGPTWTINASSLASRGRMALHSRDFATKTGLYQIEGGVQRCAKWKRSLKSPLLCPCSGDHAGLFLLAVLRAVLTSEAILGFWPPGRWLSLR